MSFLVKRIAAVKPTAAFVPRRLMATKPTGASLRGHEIDNAALRKKGWGVYVFGPGMVAAAVIAADLNERYGKAVHNTDANSSIYAHHTALSWHYDRDRVDQQIARKPKANEP